MKRKREKKLQSSQGIKGPDFFETDIEYAKKFVSDIITRNLDDVIVSLVFASLRDRPFLLLHIYKELGLMNKRHDTSSELQLKIRQIFQTVFSKIWFISFKDMFPDEMIYAFEYDYIVKHKITYPKILRKWVYHMGIKLMILDPDSNRPYLSNFHISQENHPNNISVLNLYMDNYMKRDTYYIENSVNTKKFSSLKQASAYLYIKNLREYRKYDDDVLYVIDTSEYLGFQIKMRRIYYKLIDYIVSSLSKTIEDFIIIIKPINNNHIIMDELKKTLSNIEDSFNTDVTSYIRDNQYDEDKGIISYKDKAAYFNHFQEFKELNSVINSVPETGGYKTKVIELFDKLIYELTAQTIDEIPIILYNIIAEVEKEIDFPDNIPFRFYFKDDLNASYLNIDTEKFRWFYSYYNTSLNKIVDMTPKEIKDANDKLSMYWFAFINYRLSEVDTREKLIVYSHKITL